jgi:DNA-binding IclR family transcriptional regulator
MPADVHGGITSVDRALRILQLLDDVDGMRVMDVADELGVARSTAHRLLTALLRRGFVVQDAGKIYHRGPAMGTWDGRPSGAALLTAAARGPLTAVSARVGETCHVAVLEGNGTRFLDGVEPAAQARRVGNRTGMLLPAHSTAAGKALLAELSKADLFALYPRGLPGANGIAARTALQQELASIRRLGYATNLDEAVNGLTAAGVVVRETSGRAVASLAVACPSARCSRSRIEEFVAELRVAVAETEAAIRVSQKHRQPPPTSFLEVAPHSA